MQYKDYSTEIWNQIKNGLELVCKSSKEPLFAAFDADGTLWDTDLGESFFKYQIDHCNLPNLPADPWKYYRNSKESGDPRNAYLWLAQINEGQNIDTVRHWANQNLANQSPLPLFYAQQKLIQLLHSYNVKTLVVTASVTWAVEPGAKIYNIPYENVLGVETKIKNGIITREQNGSITYREGKAARVLEFTNGVKPILCGGNTMGDFELLKIASKFSIAVTSADKSKELFPAESKLQDAAKKEAWITHSFI